MTATQPYAPPPRSSWSAGRIVALVVGLVLLLPGLALVVGGGALLWADGQRDNDGYLMSDAEGFSSPGFALTSEQLDLSTGADWLPVSATLGTARIEVTGTAGSDVFVGIAPTADARAYLQGVRRTVVDDLGAGLGSTGQTQVDGDAPAGAPGDEDFWVAQASGTGTQALTWEPAKGNWMLVVMNADASAGVSVSAAAGATVPSLDGLAWGLLIAGAVLTLAAVLLIVLAARAGSRRTAPPAYPPAAGPTAWAPPAPRESTDGEPARRDV